MRFNSIFRKFRRSDPPPPDLVRGIRFPKARTLYKTVSYVYSQDPVACAARDFAFIVQTGLDMYFIKLGGEFIDSTADILRDWDRFDPNRYFFTESFQFLALSLAIWILTKIVGNLRGFLKEKIYKKVIIQANYDMISKVSAENLQEVEQKEFQELITFVPSFAVDKIFETYDYFSEVVRHLITAISAFFILFGTMGSSVAILFIIAIPEPVFHYFADNKLRNFKLKEVKGIKMVNYLLGLALDIPSFAELRVNGIYSHIRKGYSKGDREYMDGTLREYRELYSENALTATIGQVLKYTYIIYILAVSIEKKLTIGHFKALYDYASTGYDSSYRVLRNSFIVYDNLSYTSEFFKFLEYEGFGDLISGDATLGSGTPQIRLENLDFEYPDDKIKVLENVNISIEPGERVAFVGGDGSGKSSLIKTLCGLYEIKAGDYTLNGLSVRELARGELKKELSVVFQNFVRYNFTIQQNITISGEKDRLNKTLYENVKKVAQVDQFMKKESLKDSQILGKYFPGGREISPGYWQRLAIARMLYRNKNIFIMDEPFTFIDGPSKVEILKNIMRFVGREKTLIYITQDTDHLRLFDKIYYIHQGRVLEEGTYNELMKKKGKFYKEAKSNS